MAEGPDRRALSEGTQAIRIAMVTPYWYPIRGGVTSYVSNLVRELSQVHGYDVHIIAQEGAGPEAVILGGAPLEFARRAARELDRIRPQIVHAHGTWYTLYAGLLHRHRNPVCKVVLTLHTEFEPGSLLKRTILHRILSQADFLTPVSLSLLRSTILGFRPRTRCRVIHPGVRGASEEDRSKPNRSSTKSSDPIIAFVGPLAYQEKVRGLRVLIRSMGGIRARWPGAKLIVAGDGPFRKELEDLASDIAPGGVEFLGNVADPAPVYREAMVLAHISFQEGLPIAILEAMASGLPVVATSVGGIPEIIHDGVNGLLSSGDQSDVERVIASLIESSTQREEIGAAAKADVAARFRWPSAATRYLEIYGQSTPKKIVLTVDVEKDYHANGDAYRGIEEALPRIAGILHRNNVPATYFVTADLCSSFGDRFRELSREGNEIGCHGETHDVSYLSSKPYVWQRDSISRATQLIRDSVGIQPSGFRAPNFSANGATMRALEGLGYKYDSSVLPGRVVRRLRLLAAIDFLSAPRDPYMPESLNPGLPGRSSLIELPVTENPYVSGGPIGLGFLNTYGVEKTLAAIETSVGDFCVLLLHTWECVDPPEGRIPSWMRTACTSDITNLEQLVSRILKEHEFVSVKLSIEGLHGFSTPGGQGY